MFEDYKQFYMQHKKLFEDLFHHNSLVFFRIKDVLEVLNYMVTLEKKEIDETMDSIFDSGFAYIYVKTMEINTYLTRVFDNDLHRFLEFEELVNYTMYVDDLKDVLKDKEVYNELIAKEFDNIQNRIEDIIDKKEQYTEDIINEFNAMLMSVVPSHGEYLTVPEVFMRVAEELQI